MDLWNSSVVIGVLWYFNKNGLISWFGEYQIGAELIIYNAIVSFVCLWLISYRPKPITVSD